MRLIQFILIPLLAFVVMYFARLRSRLLNRIIVLLLGTVGIVLVIMPDWANRLAQLVDVGRGADLITYLGVVGLSFLFLVLYSRLRALESHVTELARAEAIEHARARRKADEGNTGD